VKFSANCNYTNNRNTPYLDADKIKAIFLGNHTSKKRFSSSRSAVQQQAGANPKWTAIKELWILKQPASHLQCSQCCKLLDLGILNYVHMFHYFNKIKT